jgi:predicted ArsR family transcriptional regulator
MKQQLIEQVGRTSRLRVLNELKRTPAGLAVRDLAERMGMSYMGVKEICLDLEKRGLLDTWRDPVRFGRPRLLYRITPRAHELFPTASNPLTLEILHAAQKLFGASAPDKMLMVAYQEKAQEYRDRIGGDTVAKRAASLARLRETAGHMAVLHEDEPEGLRIVEHHSPILDVLRAYPIVAKLESELFERVIGAPVRRAESAVSGLFCATYYVGDTRNVAVTT